MNPVFAIMNSFLVSAILFCVLAPHLASAVDCSNFPCLKSDHTLLTCNHNTHQCDCDDGFQPIETGCAQLHKPEVKMDAGRINQCVPGGQVRLNCSTNEPGALEFQWFKDKSPVPNENKQSLLLQCDDSVIGKYTCIVKDTVAGLASEASEEQAIVPFDATNVSPKVTTPPPQAAAGIPLDLPCYDIPYGATYIFKVDTTPVKAADLKQSTGKQIKCVLDALNGGKSWKNPESLPVDMPTEATDISAVFITPATAVTVATGASVTFTCLTSPEAKLLEADKITYSFEDSENPTPTPDANKYTVKPAGGKKPRTVSCAAKYGANAPKKIGPVTVTISDNVKPPTLNATSTLVKPGSNVSLTCTTDETQVAWAKNGKTIPWETERIIQFGKFQPEYAGKYVCSITKDFYTAESNDVVINSNAPVRVLGSAVTVLAAVLGWRVL